VAYRSTVVGPCYSSSADPFSEVAVFETTICTDSDSTASYFMDASCAPESADGDNGGEVLKACELRAGAAVYDTTLCSFSPTSQPSSEPSGQPSGEPSGQPSAQPSAHPSETPLVSSTAGFLLERFYLSDGGGACAEEDLYQENGERASICNIMLASWCMLRLLLLQLLSHVLSLLLLLLLLMMLLLLM
jgi:hypothetical protein